MNIFVLNTDPWEASKLHCDKHVVKMVLEAAQLLSTTNDHFGVETKYKPTHKNHPCAKWARESSENYIWLWAYGKALAEEYSYRYGKTHKSELVIDDLADIPPGLPDGELTPFAQCMPDEYKNGCPVVAYQKYYREDKSSIATYKSREVPSFMRV